MAWRKPPHSKDWVENEFPAGALELDGVNYRQFMKVMAASFGLAGLGMADLPPSEQAVAVFQQPGEPRDFRHSGVLPRPSRERAQQCRSDR